jgi:predicted secreted Zn-dependent protease
MTRISALLACALACGITSASATMRIVADHGGSVGKYLQAFAKVRSTGERVVIDGDCLSACTMVLGLVPSNQICATARARFGFHVASMLNNAGQPVANATATQALWNVYPASVQRWINQHGGLSRKMIYMEGPELDGIVATCDRQTLRALLVAGASGYSGTLRPISHHQPIVRAFSAR